MSDESSNARNEIVPVSQIARSESPDSMVARGLRVIKGEGSGPFLSDEALRVACEEAFEREEYDRAYELLCTLDFRGSQFVDKLSDMFALGCNASCLRHEGEEYDDDKRAERLLECLDNAAGRGNSLAQDILVSYYCFGSWADAYEPERDDAVAKLAIEAAENGRRNSQANLAMMYYQGNKGLPKDHRAAFNWFMRVAESGDPNVQLKVGDMYRKGEGIERDAPEAIRWFEKVAAVDDDDPVNRDAAFRLSDIYLRGEMGVPDYGNAYRWLQVGLAPNLQLGDEDTQWLARLKQRLDPLDIAAIDRTVGEWVRDHRKNASKRGGWICLPQENTAAR